MIGRASLADSTGSDFGTPAAPTAGLTRQFSTSTAPWSTSSQATCATFLDLFGGKDIAEAWTTSDDAENSKPEPDIVRVALQQVRGARGIMIGDPTWDCIAAGTLDVPTFAVRTGGFSADELRRAGAAAVYESLDGLLADLDNTPLRPRGPGTATESAGATARPTGLAYWAVLLARPTGPSYWADLLG